MTFEPGSYDLELPMHLVKSALPNLRRSGAPAGLALEGKGPAESQARVSRGGAVLSRAGWVSPAPIFAKASALP